MTKAYSYIRFSSQKQELGDSLRRQLALSKAYAGKHDLELDNSTYRDLGLSAYDMSNLERGALAAFLDAVKSGVVPPGSYLLVENLDRLSRAQVHTALRLLTDLVDAGIVVVTLTDDKVWDKETIQDVMSLLLSVLIFYRAHDESKQKSRLLKAVWSRKREQAYAGVLPTSEVQRWLRVLPGRTGVEAIPELVESIDKVFALLAAGFGAAAIVTRANGEQWPAPSTSGIWHLSLINRLFNNRALLGEYQPHVTQEGRKRVPVGDPIKLFPVVVSQEQWDLVHHSRRLRQEMPRRRDAQYKNIFQGILLCGHCGASFVRKQKSATDRPSGYNKAGYTRYYCADRILGLSKCPSCADSLVEGSLLSHILTLAGAYLAQTDEAAQRVSAEVDRLKALIAGYDDQLVRLTEVAEKTDSLQAVIDRLNSVQADKAKAGQELLDVEARLNALSSAVDEEADLASIGQTMTSPDPAGRAALREKLIRLVTRIWIWPDKEVAAVEWRATGDVVGIPLGGSVGDANEALTVMMSLQRPTRQSGRVKRKPS